MEEVRRVAFIDIYVSDDDYEAVESSNLEEIEKGIQEALTQDLKEKNSDVILRIHSVIALRSTVEITVYSLEEDIEFENTDFIDEVNDILLTQTMTSFAYVTLQVKKDHCVYLENELSFEENI